MPESDLVKTGIKGLDEILFGGIPRGNIILVAGTAGTGETTLGVEFVYRGARQFNEPGVIVLFEVAPDKLIRDAALFGWDVTSSSGVIPSTISSCGRCSWSPPTTAGRSQSRRHTPTATGSHWSAGISGVARYFSMSAPAASAHADTCTPGR